MIRLIQGIVPLPGCGIVRVSGLSMAPVLEEGDFVLFRRFAPGESPSPGMIVVVRHRRLGTIIKLLDQEIGPGRFRLRGLSMLSTDSRHLGDAVRQDIIGRAVLRIWRHGVSRLRVS